MRFFSPIAKWAAEISSVERIPEYTGRAFQVARAGRPGPVVLSLPEDMLNETADVLDRRPMPLPRQEATARDAIEVIERISKSRRPLVVAGGSLWSSEAEKNLGRFARAFNLPVVASFRRQDYLDNRHPCYVGDLTAGMNPLLADRVASSDCILVSGQSPRRHDHARLRTPETTRTVQDHSACSPRSDRAGPGVASGPVVRDNSGINSL